MKFGHTWVENMSVDSQVVDWREVQRLSSPSLTAADSMIHQLIYIHANMCEPAQSFLPSCEVQVFILPLHLSLFISLFIPWLKVSLVFSTTLWVLGKNEQLDVFSVCSKFYVLCIRMNFASRLLLSQLFDKSQTQGQVLTGSIRDDLTDDIWMSWVTSCNYGAFWSMLLTDKLSKTPPVNYDTSVLPKC